MPTQTVTFTPTVAITTLQAQIASLQIILSLKQ